MKQSGVRPNVITYSALISACGKGSQTEKALEVFAEMKQSGLKPNVITYSALISACVKGNQTEKALEVFAKMKRSGVKPDAITYDSLSSVLQKMSEVGASHSRDEYASECDSLSLLSSVEELKDMLASLDAHES